uniref:Uncharacterized protein n=1 Tax=Cacopsylla melanoneura TaxID=428564 RepID=A0A8D8VGS8_9HEMI
MLNRAHLEVNHRPLHLECSLKLLDLVLRNKQELTLGLAIHCSVGRLLHQAHQHLEHLVLQVAVYLEQNPLVSKIIQHLILQVTLYLEQNPLALHLEQQIQPEDSAVLQDSEQVRLDRRQQPLNRACFLALDSSPRLPTLSLTLILDQRETNLLVG